MLNRPGEDINLLSETSADDGPPLTPVDGVKFVPVHSYLGLFVIVVIEKILYIYVYDSYNFWCYYNSFKVNLENLALIFFNCF